MKIKIEFSCDNAAFEDDFESEIVFITKQIQRVILSPNGDKKRILRDSNGNTIGSVNEVAK